MMPELKITQLRHFVWVAELKGFHVAAERAHRTQPAISLSIKDLENKLGEDVFEKRNTKSAKAELTPFGELFLPKAKELIAHHDRITQDMMLMADHKTGHIRLASVPSIASQVLPELLLEFVADAPDLNVSFFDDNSDAVLNMIENQQVDFGIASLFHKDEHPDKLFHPIWEDQIGVVCPNDHPLAKQKGIHWKTLLEHRFISNGTSRLLEDSEASPLLGRSQFYISNMISLIAMLEAGVGITTLPRYAFPKESKSLCFIPLDTPHVVRRIGLVQLNNKSLSPAANALADFILAKAKR
ncbi:LysR substrate-binding domain-containing protein [Marinomonas sp. 15G1-11]|uniref:LysR substrate-binding domain-containing protein n=1 Tax=Marinomonas phaeophyticola TaxID=3004091 RepID=A0ABT4JX78_9GAMM|nr:LysR substrate-binding domain-containing protein [Marinomonas sp. 15G1-11]MCZ2722993.1 LysR substrate-binding domain-containing protein [Marinomonas sp. 15G1-11]